MVELNSMFVWPVCTHDFSYQYNEDLIKNICDICSKKLVSGFDFKAEGVKMESSPTY